MKTTTTTHTNSLGDTYTNTKEILVHGVGQTRRGAALVAILRETVRFETGEVQVTDSGLYARDAYSQMSYAGIAWFLWS